MGRKDAITRDYLQNNEVFADVFNYQLFDGEPVIRPENLMEMDSSGIFFLPAVPGGKKPEEEEHAEQSRGENSKPKPPGGSELVKNQFRDLLRNTVIRQDSEAVYQLRLGLEPQTKVHYAMPVRNQLYDAAEYFRQVERIVQGHKSRKDHRGHSGGEYISHFYKEDRLVPVFTLTVYFGAEPWDGPMSLHEMLDTKDPEILKFVPDYKLHLIEPSRLTEEDLLKFQSSFREVMGYIKYSKDAAALSAYTRDNPRMNMDIFAARVISAMTNTPMPRMEEKEEKVNMCKAIDDMVAQAKAEGKSAGLAEGEVKGTIQTLTALVHDGILTVMDAAKRAGMSVEDFQKMCI